jgi:hypothetical protein
VVIGPGPAGPRTGPIARVPAQRLARDEMSRAIYHQTSITQVVSHAIGTFLRRIFQDAGGVTPGGWWTMVALAALVAAVVAVVIARIGPLAGSALVPAPVRDPGSRPLTARQLRDAAAASAAEGDYSTAILQRLRAIAAGCEERGVLVPNAGRTADELAAQAGARFPGHGGELTAAARLFDQIRYGDGSGTLAGYERLRDLDDALGKLPAATATATAATR